MSAVAGRPTRRSRSTAGAGKPIRLPRPGHADLAGVAQVRPRGRAQRARAGQRPRDGGAGGGRRGGQGAHAARSGSRCARTCCRSDRCGRRRRPGCRPPTSTAPRPARCAASTPSAEAAMIAEIEAAKSDRDTLGGVTEVRAFGVPPGLGSHVSAGQRLDGRLAAAMLSIQSAKGVEIGDAIASAGRRGSSVHDEILHDDERGLPPRDRPGRRARGRHHERRRPGRAHDLEAAADADAPAAQASSWAATSRARRTSSAATSPCCRRPRSWPRRRSRSSSRGPRWRSSAATRSEDFVAAHAAYMARIARA